MKKETATFTPADIETFIEKMKVNKMYELPDNPDIKWAMIEHNEFGYCWTVGHKGICTTIYSTGATNDIKYWTTEAEAKSDLIEKILQVGNK